MIKIDKHFVDKIVETGPDQVITGEIVSMAHKLGHKVVAEGAETYEQREYLLKVSCDCVQEYLFSRPLQDEAAIAFLDRQNLDTTNTG